MSNVSVKQAIDEFLLSCKVEGKSCGTIESYSDGLLGVFPGGYGEAAII